MAKVLKLVKFFRTKFSVRSGGHSPNPGWSNVNDNGLLIDLRRINQLSVSSDSSVVSLGPGLRWGDVYNALDPYGVSLIGGRIPQVGVGGLILGGWSPRCDHVANKVLIWGSQVDSFISPASTVSL